MEDEYKIYVDQLRNGREQIIQERLEPDFLDIQEEGLLFNQPVELTGKVYLAESELLLRWNVKTIALISCRICNRKVPVEIHLSNVYHSIPLSDIPGGIFNYKELLRETILLEVPTHVECEGSCPQRKEYAKYLKEPSDQQPKEENGYRPFADFDWK